MRDFVTLGRRQIAMGESDSVKAWEIPLKQRDPSAAGKLAEALSLGGVELAKTDSSIIVPMAQPFRAHAKDVLEIQHYPKRTMWPGGPPEQPYDVTGWTLPLQMGVRVRALDKMPAAAPMGGTLSGFGDGNVSSIEARITDEYSLLAGALAHRHRVTVTSGTNHYTLTRMPRIAVYRPWTANMDEGWTRWVLEQFKLPSVSLTDSVARAGKLRDHFDVLLVPDMSLREMRDGNSASDVPPRYAGGLGASGIDAIREFVTNGGTLVLLDRASELATESLGVPVQRIVVPRRLTDESRSHAPAPQKRRNRCTHRARSCECSWIRRTQSAYGMPDTAAVYFTNSVTFDVQRRVASTGDRTIPRPWGRHSAEWILCREHHRSRGTPPRYPRRSDEDTS